MVDWSRIHDAYGSAQETGVCLDQLASGDEAVQEQALDELFGRIAHQGTVYEASLAAVPFLLKALPKLAPANRELLLALLATIALSEDCREVGHEALQQAVARGIETYVDLMQGETARDREAASLLLALCEDQASELTPLLRFRMRMETDERAQAGLLLALARLGGREGLDLLTAAFRDHEGLVRLAAVLGAHHVAPLELPVDMKGFLLRTLVHPLNWEELWAGSFWAEYPEAIPGPGEVAETLDSDELDRSRVALFDALPYAEAEIALSILEILICTEFLPATGPPSPGSLMEGGRDVLQALLASPYAWPPTVKLAGILQKRGLPTTREGLEAIMAGA